MLPRQIDTSYSLFSLILFLLNTNGFVGKSLLISILLENLINSNYQTNFIVLSAFQEFEYAKKAISMGAQNYILKPIDTEELERSLINIKNKLKDKENRNKDKEVVNNSLLKKIITDKDYENIDYLKVLA